MVIEVIAVGGLGKLEISGRCGRYGDEAAHATSSKASSCCHQLQCPTCRRFQHRRATTLSSACVHRLEWRNLIYLIFPSSCHKHFQDLSPLMDTILHQTRITGCIWHVYLAFQVKIWTLALQLFDEMSERTLKQDWFGDGDETIVNIYIYIYISVHT